MTCRDQMNVAEIARKRPFADTKPTTEPPPGTLSENNTLRGEHPEHCMCVRCRPPED